MFDATTSTLTIGWDHAEGPVRQYKISYAPMTGDPITEYVSKQQWPLSGTLHLMSCCMSSWIRTTDKSDGFGQHSHKLAVT